MAASEDDKNVQIAIGFLNNPKVKPATKAAKEKFLKKKGLNQEQIDLAFKLAKEKEEEEKRKEATKDSEAKPAEKENGEPEESIESLIEKAKTTNFLALKKRDITELPESIFQLENLETLILNQLKLKSIPQGISKLKNLKVLHIIGCQLNDKQIPTSIFEMNNLVELNLSKNTIVNLQPFLKLTGLKVLDLSDNQLLKIPEDVDKFVHIELLNLRNNNISTIPSSIANLKSLKKMLVKGNNLDSKLENVLRTKGLKGLIEYLNEDY